MEFSEFIGIRVRPTDREALEELASRERMTLSEVIRHLILREARRDLQATGASTVRVIKNF
jgi:hypothetical protein